MSARSRGRTDHCRHDSCVAHHRMCCQRFCQEHMQAMAIPMMDELVCAHSVYPHFRWTASQAELKKLAGNVSGPHTHGVCQFWECRVVGLKLTAYDVRRRMQRVSALCGRRFSAACASSDPRKPARSMDKHMCCITLSTGLLLYVHPIPSCV